MSAIAYVALLAPVPAQFVPYLPQLGHTRLQNTLGTATPDGTGVPVAQVEGSSTASPVTYLPNAGVGTFPGTFAFFSGKTFTAESGGSGNLSGHALSVASYFYSNKTDPNIDSASMAPGVTTISCFEATDFITGGVSTTGSRNKKIHSNAWISYSNPAIPLLTPANVNNYLRLLDREIDSNGFLSIVGVNNGVVAVPELLAAAYNVLSVGLSNGNHSAGLTPATVDGSGRMKPDIVAPGGTPPNFDKTSFSTGQVCSVAAVIYEAAMADAALANASVESEAMKAVLMAGATKEEFPGWSNSPAAPLDATFGAGEANVFESYRILTAGEQAAGGAADLSGWDFGTVPIGGAAQDYTITIPDGFFADELSIVVTWNRYRQGPNYIVRDLALQLLDSGSPVERDRSDSGVDNVEHIYYRGLPPGQYTIRVTRNGDSNTTTNYGLAWRTALGIGPRMAADYDDDTGNVALLCSKLDPKVVYRIERSLDLENWTEIGCFDPLTPTDVFVDPAVAGDYVYYRLRWVPFSDSIPQVSCSP